MALASCVRRSMFRFLSIVFLLIAGAVFPGGAGAQMGGPPGPPGGPPACPPGGASSAGNCPSWGGYIKPMPGTVCTMNVGNNNPHDGYTNKVRNCSELLARRSGVSGEGCDVINIIELNSDDQCDCACDGSNLCDIWDATHEFCLQDSPGRPPGCLAQGYYDQARCDLCHGCANPPKPEGCYTQAAIVCDPQQYTTSCTQIGDKGCDCMCVKKGPCTVGGGSCVGQWIQNPPGSGCDAGNYATCQKCDYDGDGSYDYGACIAHPPHCNLGAGSYTDPATRQACLARCSTPLLEGAAQFIADAKIKMISGDLNCDPRPDPACNVPNPLWPIGPMNIRLFGQCPWVSSLHGYGLDICNFSDATTLGGCAVDLVLSNACGCGSQRNIQPSPGDHSTIAFHPVQTAWAGPFVESAVAESATSCPDPDQHIYTSDVLGAIASCPAVDNGHAVPGCSSWGHVYQAKLRYDSAVDECYLAPEHDLTPPKVLVCDVATASAWAQCTPNASSGSSSFVTVGVANASQAATCVNGVPYNPPAKVVQKSEVVTPDLVSRNGEAFFRVERDAHLDRGGECNAPVPQPCDVPANPVSPTSLPAFPQLATRVVAEPVCAVAVDTVDD